MSDHIATVIWQRNGEDFLHNKYHRTHTWEFDGGAKIDASASPQIVPLPWSSETGIDPEEAFVASLSSCHMLFFLSLAVEQGIQVESYRDGVVGKMGKNESGEYAITQLVLKPQASYSEETVPSEAEEEALHQQAHQQCFITNSVKTVVTIEIQR